MLSAVPDSHYFPSDYLMADGLAGMAPLRVPYGVQMSQLRYQVPRSWRTWQALLYWISFCCETQQISG